MLCLGIETSCDETAVAVVEDGRKVLSNVISSSQKTFENLAGVIPEQAARMQVECMIPVLKEALVIAKVSSEEIDAIAVTKGPGLLGSLLVGTATARVLSQTWKKPLVGVHHTLGHLSSTWLAAPEEPQFPLLTLSASGGHSDLWLRESHTRGTLLGRTRDDAAGEAFDKGASMLGLPYPGGPHLSKLAETGNPESFAFPRPLHEDPSNDYSFSGLKTALKYLLRDVGDNPPLTDIAASYEYAICRHLLDRVEKILRHRDDIRELHLVGGVSANRRLRSMAQKVCADHDCVLRVPTQISFCTDNAAMIAAAGYFMIQELDDNAFGPFETEASLMLAHVISQP